MVFDKLRPTVSTTVIIKLLVLIVLASGIIYTATVIYIDYSRDRLLRAKMAYGFESLKLAVPPELQLQTEGDTDHREAAVNDSLGEALELYDDDTAWSFVAALDQNANHLDTISGISLHVPLEPFAPAAFSQAREFGFDLRTLYTENGDHVRLLTYRLPSQAPAAFLQVGISLLNEDRVKHHFLLVLFVGSVLFSLAAGNLSWLLTRQSLRTLELQQNLIANASHELRTPLTLIRASAQFLQKSLTLGNSEHQLMEDVLSETDHMTKLVDDLLLLSRLEVNDVKLELSPIQLADMLSTIHRHFNSLATERKVHISLGQASGSVLADSTRLWQIILILVDNAIHHTPPEGQVTLSAGHWDHHYVEIRIVDTGEGIAQKDLPHIFERFYRAPNNHAGRYSTGLGLSIAKTLVELHRGTIHIDSKLGMGTTVSVRLPALPSSSLARGKHAFNPR